MSESSLFLIVASKKDGKVLGTEYSSSAPGAKIVMNASTGDG